MRGTSRNNKKRGGLFYRHLPGARTYLFLLFLCFIFSASSITADQKPWRVGVVHGNGHGLHGVGAVDFLRLPYSLFVQEQKK